MDAALNRFESCKKVLIVPDKKSVEKVPSGIDLLDARDVLKLCRATVPAAASTATTAPLRLKDLQEP